MWIDALTDELHPRLQDEIAGHPLPDEMELVFLRPHVHATRRQRVLLRDGVEDGRAGDLRRADVGVSVELADGRALTDGLQARQRDDDRGDSARAQRMVQVSEKQT